MSDAARAVRALLEPVADAGRAPDMAAYMKQVAPFLGVPAPQRRAATRAWVRALDPGPASRDLLTAAHDLVTAPEREFAYVATDLVAHHARSLPEASLPDLRDLALERPWWDTIDAWSAVIGKVGLQHRSWDQQVAEWARDDRLWVRRIALVFQVGRKDQVDLELLFAVCEANSSDPDFFMRKGIGWGLRDAARTHPEAIRAFVATHKDRLAPLSVREATKHL